MADSLLITGASQLLTLRGRGPRRGSSLSNLGLIEDGALLVRDGLIAAVGTSAEVEKLPEARTAEKLDLGGRVALPGFVDSHTHLIHAASRAEEYELKIAGASYEEIARKGGGILNSVKKLRAATSEALKKRALAALKKFAAHGTTTVEAKSGYGLDVATEMKILRLHKELAVEQPLEIVSTFLGAHMVPAEYRGKTGGAARYIQLIEQNLLPEIGENRLAEFCDVFCDRGAFTVEQSKRVLQAGRQWGLAPRLHAEQLSRTGAARLAILLRAAFHLGLKQYAPARALIEAGAIVSLATDYNPGTSPTLSMPMILSLACTQLRMTPAEAIAAATINAACALLREKSIGSLEVGKQADLAVFELADYREIPYYFGVNHCWMTLKRGRVIHAAEKEPI